MHFHLTFLSLLMENTIFKILVLQLEASVPLDTPISIWEVNFGGVAGRSPDIWKRYIDDIISI